MSGIYVEEYGVYVDDDWLQEAVSPVAQKDYGHLFEESHKLFSQGVENASLAPATQFFVDASLAALNHDQIAYQIPEEVDVRYRVALAVSRRVTALSVVNNEIHNSYEGTELYKGMGSYERGLLVDEEHLQSLPSAVFSDTSTVAGGALRLLQHNEMPGIESPDIIKRSKGLLAAAKIMMEVLPLAYRRLGEPYVYTPNLTLDSSQDEPRVRFNSEITALLRGFYKGSGCPIGKIKAQDSSGTILQQSWRELVDYLVPKDATVHLYREDPELAAA